MADYHGRIMNIRTPSNEARNVEYKVGHHDARHAAARIALEAETEIAGLRSRVAEMEAALREINGCVGGTWERFDAVVSVVAAALAGPAKTQGGGDE
jgi:hypothetical protein